MADGKYSGAILSEPTGAGCMRYLPRRAMQREDEANGAPSGIAHPDDDRWFQNAKERQQVLLGAGVHPARQNGRIHRPCFGAQDGVGQRDAGAAVAPRGVLNCNPSRRQ